MKTNTNERKVVLFYNTMWGVPLPLPLEGQKWVAWSLESEENYSLLRNREFMSFFDYTMTYRQHSDIVQAYYEFACGGLYSNLP